MAKDKYGGHAPKVESTVRTGRKQLMDVTNTGVRLSASLKDAFGDALSTPLSKGCTAHLLKEVGLLQKCLAEKEAIIESKNLKLKRILINCVQLSQQNKELAKRNSEISKELTLDREKLKLVQHKFKQMSAMFKAKIAELEDKSNDLSHLLRDMQERERQSSDKIQGEQQLQSNIASPTREIKDSSSTTSGNLSNEGGGSSNINESASEQNSSEGRRCLRRRSAKINYREPSLKNKLRKNNQHKWFDKSSFESNCHSASPDGLDNLEKVYENEVLQFSEVPQSNQVTQDHSASGQLHEESIESCQSHEDDFFSSMKMSAFRGKAARDKIESKIAGELQFSEVPQSNQATQDHSASGELHEEFIESCQSLGDAFFSSMKMSAFRGKAARVKIEQHQDEEQEGCSPINSSLNAALSLESTHPLRPLAGRPVRKAAEIVASYKETPLNIKLRRPA